ncbi:drug/metabolite transporter (DMT)-like permease [Methylovorus glucosotrophus]|uniref:DMT family transporter n=1 Tax=Methylovorus glucosotrophus TaxID=266009 RepID=UPI0013318B82|nr:DMT family transporter [Methylovorus glucosotrophus]KAF0842858.1 drug/metabolite transporter (DMT)-like permease [Methylovorus glucosotrophus]
MIRIASNFAKWLWHSPIVLLMYTASIWGCNAVAARLAAGNISPMCLVLLRWLIVCSILFACMHGTLGKILPMMRMSWRRFIWMGFAGFTGFSALFYLAAYKTTAVNITLLQTSMPPMVMLGALLFYKEEVTGWRLAGMLLALAGMVLIATRGDMQTLATMNFNIGDIAIIAACILYAGYTLSLRSRPSIPALQFFFGLSLSALASALPLAIGEIAAGYAYWPSVTGWWVLLFVAFGPTLTAQLAYMRGVDLIGPSRASLFPCLVPALGALCAVLTLGESFHLYHGIALGMGLTGVYLGQAGPGFFRPMRWPFNMTRLEKGNHRG